jgi:hypothetical protein
MVLGEHATSGPSFILVPADPYAPTCVYVEMAAHIARMSATDDHRTDLQIAVVSSNTALRTFHRRVRIGQQPNVETIVPTEAVSNGSILRYGDSEAPGATLFVERVSDLAGVGALDLAVVDAPCPDMAQVLEFARFAVFVVRDPSNHMITRLAETMPTFGWSPHDVAATRERMLQRGPHFEFLEARLNTLARGSSTVIEPVVADAVARLAGDAWGVLPDVIRNVPPTSAGRDLLKLSFSRYFVLLNQVVPTLQLRRYYGDGLLRGIESAANMLRGDAGSIYIPYLVQTLTQLTAALGDEPPKAAAFARLVPALVSEHGVENVRIVTVNDASATMLREYLGNAKDAPEVVPYSALTRIAPIQHLVLTGMPPAYGRHVLSSGLAEIVHILAYAAEDLPNSEAQLSANLVGSIASYREWMARPEAKRICWGALTAEPAEIIDTHPRAPKVHVEQIELPAEANPVSLWEGLLASGALTRPESPRCPGADAGVAEAGAADASIVTFTDRRWLLLSPDSFVSRVKGGQAEEGVLASALRVADTLVVVDQDPRKMLLDKVIEQAGTVPEYAMLAELVKQWRTVLRRGYAQHGTYAALHAALADEGVNVGDQAVATWVRGNTIGPMDRENVRRVGVALGDDVLAKHYKTVCNAISTLRGIHVKLGRRVGDLVVREGVAGAVGGRGVDEVVDEVSGLTVGDFRGCVEFLTIADIRHFGTVPTQMLGTLRQPDEGIEGDES